MAQAQEQAQAHPIVTTTVYSHAGEHKYAEPNVLREVSKPFTERERKLIEYILVLRSALDKTKQIINYSENHLLKLCNSCNMNFDMELDSNYSYCTVCSTWYCEDCSLEYGECKHCAVCDNYSCGNCLKNGRCKCGSNF